MVQDGFCPVLVSSGENNIRVREKRQRFFTTKDWVGKKYCSKSTNPHAPRHRAGGVGVGGVCGSSGHEEVQICFFGPTSSANSTFTPLYFKSSAPPPPSLIIPKPCPAPSFSEIDNEHSKHFQKNIILNLTRTILTLTGVHWCCLGCRCCSSRAWPGGKSCERSD